MARRAGSPCPHCTAETVDNVYMGPVCLTCGTKWRDYRHWRADVAKVLDGGGMIVPTPPPAADEVEVDTYISSGDMKRDVEAVVEIAILESEFDTIKRIGHSVANTAKESIDKGDTPQQTLDAVLIYITEEVKTALRKQGKNIE